MGLLLPMTHEGLKKLRRLVLALALAILIALELPDVSVVRAQQAPGFYADNQRGYGNSGPLFDFANPLTSIFGVTLPSTNGTGVNRFQGLSFIAEGLYMNLRTDSQIYAQNGTTGATASLTTFYGGVLTSSIPSVPGDVQRVKPDKVTGLRVGIACTRADWDAKLLYTNYRARPKSDQARPGFGAGTVSISTFYGGSAQAQNFNVPFAATAPIIPLNSYQAEAGFKANKWDFQAGHSIRLGRLSTARLFGGLSYVDTENSLEGTGELLAGGALSLNRKTTYRGWEPKVGVDFNCPLGVSGLSLRGSGAAGVIYGTETLTVSGSVEREGTNRRNITSLEGEAGVGYSFPSMELTLGYRIERFSVNNAEFVDVGASLSSGTVVRSGNNAVVQYLDGGFLRLELKL